MTGRTAKEKALLDAVESAIEVVRPEAQRQIKTRMFYPYISDSSFMAGRDGHMLTERVDMRQTFQNVPNITYETVKRLLS